MTPRSPPQFPLLSNLSRLRTPRHLPRVRALLLNSNSGAQIWSDGTPLSPHPGSKRTDFRTAPSVCGGSPALTAHSPRPLPRTSRPARPQPALRPAPSALRSPLAVREALRLSRCLRGRTRPVFRVSAAATAGGIRGSPTGLAPSHSRRLSLPPVAATGRGSPVAESLGASVLALFQSPRVLEKRPRPGNGASRFHG